jgi:hypothetical protein
MPAGYKVKKKGKQRAEEVIANLDFDSFKNFVLDVFKLRKKRLIDFEFLPESFSLSYRGEIAEVLKERHKLDEAKLMVLIEAFSNIIRTFITDNETQFIELFEDEDNKIKAKEMYNFIKECPVSLDIKERYLLITYCKTKFLRDWEWEINIKKFQEKEGLKEELLDFPFCLMRLFLQTSPSPRIDDKRQTQSVSIELSLSDVTELIETFTNIKDIMIKEAKRLNKMGTK